MFFSHTKKSLPDQRQVLRLQPSAHTVELYLLQTAKSLQCVQFTWRWKLERFCLQLTWNYFCRVQLPVHAANHPSRQIHWIQIWWLGRPLMFSEMFETTLWHGALCRMEVSWCGVADPTLDNILKNKLTRHLLQTGFLNILAKSRGGVSVQYLYCG